MIAIMIIWDHVRLCNIDVILLKVNIMHSLFTTDFANNRSHFKNHDPKFRIFVILHFPEDSFLRFVNIMTIFVIIACPGPNKLILHEIDIATGHETLKNETN